MNPLLQFAAFLQTQLQEKGRMLSGANEKLIRTALESIAAILAKMEPVEEAERSYSDKVKALYRAIKAALMAASPTADYVYCYISPDGVFDTYVVYESGGRYWSVPYEIAEDGSVTLGAATEVVPRTVYDPVESSVTESALVSDPITIELVEAGAALREASATLKIIAPGWGSSGFYSPEVLEAAAPLFKKGTKGYWDHPTAAEEAARPEGSLLRLSHELTEDAKYMNGPKGPGLYASAKVFDQYAAPFKDLAPHIGMSIRAYGTVKSGEAEGRKGPIVEKISGVHSIDCVTIPGAGGQIVSLFEAAGRPAPSPSPVEDENMNEAQMKALFAACFQEGVKPLTDRIAALESASTATSADSARLKESLAIRDGAAYVASLLAGVPNLHPRTRDRLMSQLGESAVVIKDGKLDRDATKAAVIEAARVELQYLEELNPRVTGMGAGSALPADAETVKASEATRNQAAENLSKLGGFPVDIAKASFRKVA